VASIQSKARRPCEDCARDHGGDNKLPADPGRDRGRRVEVLQTRCSRLSIKKPRTADSRARGSSARRARRALRGQLGRCPARRRRLGRWPRRHARQRLGSGRRPAGRVVERKGTGIVESVARFPGWTRGYAGHGRGSDEAYLPPSHDPRSVPSAELRRGVGGFSFAFRANPGPGPFEVTDLHERHLVSRALAGSGPIANHAFRAHPGRSGGGRTELSTVVEAEVQMVRVLASAGRADLHGMKVAPGSGAVNGSGHTMNSSERPNPSCCPENRRALARDLGSNASASALALRLGAKR
jgi:hypothetical protein